MQKLFALSGWAALSLLLVACTKTLPVEGTVQVSHETLTGSATGDTDGAGTLQLKSSTGATCTGTFVYASMRKGSGTLKCSDGRTGTFEFVSTGDRGTGQGVFEGNQKFTFTFG